MRMTKMYEKLIEELVHIAEEYINELDDNTVNNAREKRAANVRKSWEKFSKAKESGTPEEIEQAGKEDAEAVKKLERHDKLSSLRDERKKENKRKIAEFKAKLLNTPANAKASKKAHAEHLDAMINQYLRGKLEKTLQDSSVSESCFNDILAIMEDIIDFNSRKKKEDIAKEVNRMMASGELESIRQLPNGEIMGDAKVVKKLKDLKQERKETDK